MVGVSSSWSSVSLKMLAAAYRSGDMSLAYPLARSSPVIVVAVVTMLLGRGDQVLAPLVGRRGAHRVMTAAESGKARVEGNTVTYDRESRALRHGSGTEAPAR